MAVIEVIEALQLMASSPVLRWYLFQTYISFACDQSLQSPNESLEMLLHLSHLSLLRLSSARDLVNRELCNLLGTLYFCFFRNCFNILVLDSANLLFS